MEDSPFLRPMTAAEVEQLVDWAALEGWNPGLSDAQAFYAADRDVTGALGTLRRRAEPATKIIVMLPLSGRGRAEISRAFEAYKAAARDDNAWLIDLGQIPYGTADGQHPTAAGHRAIFEAALPAFDAILGGGSN